MILGKLIQHIQDDTIASVAYTPSKGWQQSRAILNMGIKVCNNCGTPQPSERQTCKHCKQELFVVTKEADFDLGAFAKLSAIKDAMHNGRYFPLTYIREVFTRMRKRKTLPTAAWIKIKREHGLIVRVFHGQHWVTLGPSNNIDSIT